jgi:hypothetical protein
MMMMTAPTILLQLIMTMAMWMPGVTPLMPNAALQGIEARYETDLAKRATLIETMTGLESQHQNVIGRITKLKQSPNTLTTRLALEDLLRQSKRLSEERSVRPLSPDSRSKCAVLRRLWQKPQRPSALRRSRI